RLALIHADNGAVLDRRDQIVGDDGGARAWRDRYRDTDARGAHDVSGDADVTQILPPADRDAGDRRVLDHVAGHGRVGLDADTDAVAVVRVGAGGPARDQIADEIALHDREP